MFFFYFPLIHVKTKNDMAYIYYYPRAFPLKRVFLPSVFLVGKNSYVAQTIFNFYWSINRSILNSVVRNSLQLIQTAGVETWSTLTRFSNIVGH